MHCSNNTTKRGSDFARKIKFKINFHVRYIITSLIEVLLVKIDHLFGKASLWNEKFLLMCNIFPVLAFIYHFILFCVISCSFIIYCFTYYVSQLFYMLCKF